MWQALTQRCLRLFRISRVASDPRIALARDEHRLSLASEDQAGRHRMTRDELVRTLRREDPKTWTYGALADAVGCSRELIAYIVKKDPQAQKEPRPTSP